MKKIILITILFLIMGSLSVSAACEHEGQACSLLNPCPSGYSCVDIDEDGNNLCSKDCTSSNDCVPACGPDVGVVGTCPTCTVAGTSKSGYICNSNHNVCQPYNDPCFHVDGFPEVTCCHEGIYTGWWGSTQCSDPNTPVACETLVNCGEGESITGFATCNSDCKVSNECTCEVLGTCDGGPNTGQSCSEDSECKYCDFGIGSDVLQNCDSNPCERECVNSFNNGDSCSTDVECQGICSGGANSGNSCTQNSDCQGTCSGGSNSGASCNSDTDCSNVCIGGDFPGGSCNTNVDCGGDCDGGPNNGNSCTQDADCRICSGGANHGSPCTLSSECGYACDGGPNDGQSCSQSSNSDCGGMCEGGSRDGQPCLEGTIPEIVCPGGGICVGEASCLGGLCGSDTCNPTGTCNIGTCVDEGTCNPGTCDTVSCKGLCALYEVTAPTASGVGVTDSDGDSVTAGTGSNENHITYNSVAVAKFTIPDDAPAGTVIDLSSINAGSEGLKVFVSGLESVANIDSTHTLVVPRSSGYGAYYKKGADDISQVAYASADAIFSASECDGNHPKDANGDTITCNVVENTYHLEGATASGGGENPEDQGNGNGGSVPEFSAIGIIIALIIVSMGIGIFIIKKK